MSQHEKKARPSAEQSPARRPWEPMALTDLGHVGALLQGGGGKLSPPAADSGDIRKPPGQG